MHLRRSRAFGSLGLAVIIAAGLGSRRPGMPPVVVLYVGDVFWGAMFFVLGALAWPAARTRRLWLAAVLATELIELSQLYQAPWAVRVRDTRLGGLLFGHEFLWSDAVGVALGATLAALVDAQWRRSVARRVAETAQATGTEIVRRHL
jgi:hypothetical protein